MEYLQKNYKTVVFHVLFWLAFIAYTGADNGDTTMTNGPSACEPKIFAIL